MSAPDKVIVGGLPLAVTDRAGEAELMIRVSRQRHAHGPLFFTSANGEVIARINLDPKVRRLFAAADRIVADGQPLVAASRLLCRTPLPERVATTDLFHDVARLAEKTGTTFYLLGASAAENAQAANLVRRRYPRLNLVGAAHGYLKGEALEQKLAEIDALGPDILWLGLGVPREQVFFRDHGRKLPNVGLIKTAGGLFDHMAGKTKRAPERVQQLGFEWAWRVLMEPRRLFWRYLTTNPAAAFFILTRSR